MSEKVITETTLKRVADEMNMTSILVRDIAKGYTISDWATVVDIVQSNLAPIKFNIGDQFIVNWTRNDIERNTEKVYQTVWDIKHFGTIKDADGNEHPGMFLQWHYTTPFSMWFDAPENQVCEDETFQEGYYYYLKQENGSYVQQEVQAGDPVPEEGEYVRLPFAKAEVVIQRGYNRWAHSGIRQWLNSDADKGEWWTAQHDGDMPPNNLNTYDGFMKGLDPDFLSVVKPIQITTYKNTYSDDGAAEITNDRFFLPSAEEMYGKPDVAGEGEAWEYWKEATGFDEPKNDACPGRISYDMLQPNRAYQAFLRSARNASNWNPFCANEIGNINQGAESYYSFRCAPACVIW